MGRPLLAASGRKRSARLAGCMRLRCVCTPIASMPKSTAVDRQARALCVELARVTGGRPMQSRMAQTIAEAVGQDEATADAAIAYAIGREWLIRGGAPPHSIFLAGDGRRMLGGRQPKARRW